MAGSQQAPLTENQRALLAFARSTARRILTGLDTPVARPSIDGRYGGAFVTFWRGKRLRGCVGTLAPTSDIVTTIEEVTANSLKDSRFQSAPVDAAELKSLTIEISLLSDPTPTNSPLSLTPGVHGIVVRLGNKSGCFLPQVASERGWSAETFLRQCCTTKAGLEQDAWKLPDAEALLFTAEVFDDNHSNH